ncbi:MAG TPA: MalY/PatB family protein [Candidatus Avimonas sp.]|nr:pyridoxal phosphate-dependent aminotransferase [Clostridiales bacterium]HPU58353.1 MalY/PatB family protein [Candidatus Avimonas sp.]
MFDFDTVIDRRGTHSLKYDFAKLRGKPADVLPLWVADMDFPSPPEVLKVLEERVKHGIFGYSDAADEGYFNALKIWYETRFGWSIELGWMVKTPGVVFAICAAIRSLTNPGDAVLIQQPVYYPFESSVKGNNRRLVVNQLVLKDGHYTMDLEEMERQIAEEKVKLFILCSPHNPVGRVWTREELEAVGDLCLKYGVYIVSDEIHQDFVYPGYTHHVFANIKPEFAEQSIICTAPTKTFNLAGLQISNIFIPNEKIRRAVVKEIRRTGYSQPNVMGLLACQAAYSYGEEWLEGLKKYLSANLSLMRDFINERLPGIKLIEPEGTYLAWLDFRGLGLDDSEINRIMIENARLWLDEGSMFGAGGEGFQRINIACPRIILQQALERIEKAFVLKAVQSW